MNYKQCAQHNRMMEQITELQASIAVLEEKIKLLSKSKTKTTRTRITNTDETK